MAQSGTRNTSIDFGGYEITVAMAKAATSRDLKTEYVNAAGQKVTTGGGSRKRAPGVEKAVRLSEATVVRLPADELEEIEAASKKRWETLTVLETIDYRQVPTERICGAYWLQPRAGTAKGLRLLAEGLKNTGRVAVVKWVATSVEKLGIIRVRHPFGPNDPRIALLLSELVFANDFALPDEDALSINDVEVEASAVTAAERLVKAFARKSFADGEAMIDTATNEAVDARLALFERLREEQLQRELEQSQRLAEGEIIVHGREAAA